MSDRSKRNLQRLDYNALNRRGVRTYLHEESYSQHRSSAEVDSSSDTDTFESVQSEALSVNEDTLNLDQDQSLEEETAVKELTLLVDAFSPMEESGVPVMNNMDDVLKPLFVKFNAVQADIVDQLEENVIDITLTMVEDVETCVKKVGKLRSELRRLYIEIESVYDDVTNGTREKLHVNYERIISEIKTYMNEARERNAKV